jgi:acetylornithine/succinyldiaminopimelate/putrescine aminotransferase
MSLSKEEIIRLRQTYVTPSLSVHYSQFNPLHIVRGDGLYLIDETDQPYLDCINNIALGKLLNYIISYLSNLYCVSVCTALVLLSISL